MKITSVELHPAGSASVAILSFRNPSRTNPYNVKAIAGLDAEEIAPRSHVLEKRDIIIRISLNPVASETETYSSLRDELYKLIASSRTGILQVQFKNVDTVIAAISGFITKIETTIFEKEPEVQITVSCSDSMLRAIDPTIVDVEELTPALTIVTDNLSTAPHGFIFEAEFLAPMGTFTVSDPDDDSWAFVVTPSIGFLLGDVLHFSSEHNNKYLYIQRLLSTIYLGDAIVPGSTWPIIFPGANQFAIVGGTDLRWVSMEYRPTYWGV